MKIGHDIAEEFDVFSSDYTSDMVKCVPYYLTLVQSIPEYLPENFKIQRVLDLGCGNGNLIEHLLSKYPSAEFTLVDASAEMLNICKSRFDKANLILVESYFDQFDFKDNYYDLITGSFSFHHLDSEEKQEIFEKSHSSLRQGGILATSDLMIHRSNKDHPGLLKYWEGYVNSNYPNRDKWEWLMEHYNAFDRPDNFDDQVNWLKAAGFSQVRVVWKEGYWASIQAVK